MPYRAVSFFLTLLYLLVRFQSAPAVLSPTGMVINDTDPYYRLHRIERMVNHRLNYPLHEPDLSFPSGHDVPWPIGLDLILAAPLRLFHADSRQAVEGFSAVAIPFLSLPALWFTQAAASLVAGPAAGLAAGVLLALSPAAITASSVGRIDHHFLETLMTALTFYLIALLVIKRSRWPWVMLSFVFAFGPSFWPEAWVVSIFAAGAFLIQRSFDSHRQASHLFILSSLMSVAPLAISDRFNRGTIDIFGFSWWTPMLYAAIGGVFTLLDLETRKTLRATLIQKAGIFFILGAGTFLSWKNGLGMWKNAFLQSSVALRPTVGTLATTTETFPTIFFPIRRWPDLGLIPLGLAWLWFCLQSFRKDRWWIIGYLIGPLFLSALQARFVPLAMPAMILGTVFLLNDISSWITKSVRARRIAVMIAAVLLTLPSNPEPAFKYDIKTHPFYPAVVETSGFLKNRPRGPIAAHWDFGHWLLHYTGMPVIAHPFQGASAMEITRLFVSENAGALEDYVSKYSPRYLLIERPTNRIEQWLRITGHDVSDYVAETKTTARFEQLLSPRFYLHGGESTEGLFPKNWRLVFLSYAGSDQAESQPFFKVFERVPGAKILARGVPRGTRANINVSARGSGFTYRTSAVFFPDGSAEWTLPYAKTGDGEIFCDGAVFFTLPGGKRARTVAKLGERDVLDGRLIDLGTLRW